MILTSKKTQGRNIYTVSGRNLTRHRAGFFGKMNNNNHGGKRKGAGRKTTNKKPIVMRVSAAEKKVIMKMRLGGCCK